MYEVHVQYAGIACVATVLDLYVVGQGSRFQLSHTYTLIPC